jgi:SAM-dependent methyltransferase
VKQFQHSPADAYDQYAIPAQEESPERRSEIEQLLDTLAINDIELTDATILDMSGGPGFVCQELNKRSRPCVVTEFSGNAVRGMAKHLSVEAVKLDYNEEPLDSLFGREFDLILLQSSIILCRDLDRLARSLARVLRSQGHVLIETVMPTLGEVLGWQGMEYVFPAFHSQEAVEKTMRKHGFSRVYAHRDTGPFFAYFVQLRKATLARAFFYLVELPLFWLFYILARKRKLPLDPAREHKMLTQIWVREPATHEPPCEEIRIDDSHRSFHHGLVYNGFLRRGSAATEQPQG